MRSTVPFLVPTLCAIFCSLVAIAATPGTPGQGVPGVPSTCQPDASLRQGPYEYLNNMWGSAKAKGAYEQCLVSRDVAGQRQFGWTWHWPGFDRLGFGFPEVVFGRKPWADASTDVRLPARVDGLARLLLHYDAEIEAEGPHSLALGLWLTSSRDARPASISSEIVVWLDFAPDDHPVGSLSQVVTIDGLEPSLRYDANHGDRGDGNGWKLYNLRQAKPSSRGTIDILALLARLEVLGYVQPDDFLASVEFGTELQGGRGTAWVRQFEVQLDPRSEPRSSDAGESARVSVGRIMRLGDESGERVSVAMDTHAQMYFLYRTDPGFEAHLRLLQAAPAEQRSVTVRFRQFSGRILSVEWANADAER